jgi:RNA polymerase sigma-70 factor (ECF subfamily)
MHLAFVARVARRLGTPPSEREDVCQEVFLVVFRRLRSFRRGRLTTWLYRITANVVSGRQRKRRLRKRLDGLVVLGELLGEAAASSPEQDLAARHEREGVRRILAGMAPKKAEAVALFELEGLTSEEVAGRVGCPVETVWTRLYYGRRDFKRMAQKRGLAPLTAASAPPRRPAAPPPETGRRPG